MFSVDEGGHFGGELFGHRVQAADDGNFRLDVFVRDGGDVVVLDLVASSAQASEGAERVARGGLVNCAAMDSWIA